MSTVRVSNTAGATSLDTDRSQMSLYSRYWSRVKYGRTLSGSRLTLVGRMASWASWAPARERYVGGWAGRNLAPYFWSITRWASFCALSATLVESVRMYVMRP